jgi:hypothetical protein
MTSSFSSATPAAPSKMTSPRSFAYSRSAIRVAVFGLDSAISRGIPIALIFWTTSMKRVTTAGASPSNGSSRSRPSGARAIARATAAIFFQQEPAAGGRTRRPRRGLSGPPRGPPARDAVEELLAR